jgi:cytochrome c peroxidase
MFSASQRAILAGLLLLGMASSAWSQQPSHSFTLPPGLPPIPWPADNPYSAEKAALGKLLFFDGRLAGNGISCATCHDPSHAFAGAVPFPTGANGQMETRHAPTLLNRAWGKSQLWDGRMPTLEAQILNAVVEPDEMGTTPEAIEQRLRAIKGYAPLFAAAFGDEAITFDRFTKAIATFERTIVSGNSAYDRYLAGDKSALTKRQKAGLDFFNHKGECAECHTAPNLTDEKFVNVGIGTDRTTPDPGREAVTHKKSDTGKFKVPTLRDVSRRAPYMHDGRFRTLGEVLDFYAKGGIANRQLDSRLTPFYMDEQTRADLLDFLSALNGEGWQSISAPTEFPQ